MSAGGRHGHDGHVVRDLRLHPETRVALGRYARARRVPVRQVQLAALVRTLDLSFGGCTRERTFDETLRRVLAEGPGRDVSVSGDAMVVRLHRAERARLDDALVDDLVRTMDDELEAAVFETET